MARKTRKIEKIYQENDQENRKNGQETRNFFVYVARSPVRHTSGRSIVIPRVVGLLLSRVCRGETVLILSHTARLLYNVIDLGPFPGQHDPLFPWKQHARAQKSRAS